MSSAHLYQKECPECQETFIGERLNQVYCSKKCKSRYNNYKARLKDQSYRQRQEITKTIDDILWMNRQILQEHAGEEVDVKVLQDQGFQLNYITRFSKGVDERNYLEVYDYGYYFLSSFTVKVYRV